MRTTRNLATLIAMAGAATAVVLAPIASADDDCTTTGEGGQLTGTQTTVCQSPGNFQLNATAPSPPAYLYPWDDEYYGSALILGPNEPPHSFGGYGGGGHR